MYYGDGALPSCALAFVMGACLLGRFPSCAHFYLLEGSPFRALTIVSIYAF